MASDWGCHGDASAAESFAEIVVGLALKLEAYAMGEKRSEALSGRAFESDVNALVGQTLVAEFVGNQSRQHRAYSAVGVGDCIFERHFFAVADSRIGGCYDCAVEHAVDVVHLRFCVAYACVSAFFMQQAGEVEQF